MTKKKEKYKSKEGFEEVSILRGHYELGPLWEVLEFDSLNTKTFVCGGFARWSCSVANKLEMPGDLDIYCQDENTYKIARQLLESYTKLHAENDIACSFKKPEGYDNPLFRVPKIQLIKPVVEGAIVATGDLDWILQNFDFTVVRVGIDYERWKREVALADADFLHDEREKILRIKNIHCPISSSYRCIKYAKKGYWIPANQILELFLDWENRDDEYRGKIIEFLHSEEELTQEDVDQLERMMRFD